MKSRPAESVTLAGALALLIAKMTGVTDDGLTATLGLCLGAVPLMVTSLVTHGGLKGVARLLWEGAPKAPNG